jgi:hypothetical protein
VCQRDSLVEDHPDIEPVDTRGRWAKHEDTRMVGANRIYQLTGRREQSHKSRSEGARVAAREDSSNDRSLVRLDAGGGQWGERRLPAMAGWNDRQQR